MEDKNRKKYISLSRRQKRRRINADLKIMGVDSTPWRRLRERCHSKKIFSNNLAKDWSWLGLRNNNKIQNLKSVEILKAAVCTSTDKNFEGIVSEWFRQAKQRFGIPYREAKNPLKEVRTTRILFILSHLLSTNTLKRKRSQCWRPSKTEVEEGFIIHIKITGELNDVLESKVQKLKSFGLSLQPTPVIVGPSLDEIESEESNIAHKFNKYFVESIDAIIQGIPQTANVIPHINRIPEHSKLFCNFEKISMLKMKQIIKNLKNVGGDESGISKQSWKLSTVIPVPKVQNTKSHNEFRPINTVPIYEKVIELCVKEQLLNYCVNNKIIVSNQSGFRENHSCESVVVSISDDFLKAIDCDNFVLAVFLDFKRASR
ncbi:unnamed protein product [Brassicogethes aeneus]|uniref:Reverse transcriptase domain-containing protein n=1 Tax=Brassicogethes aeneus TaxID=1431903 RepID=A0A9P0FPX8_BRAAE|nr:unnamed protein product [Brassicogethes aeneus]